MRNLEKANQLSDMATDNSEKEIEAGFTCPICHSTKRSLKFPEIEDLEYHSYTAVDYLVCLNCGLLQQYPSPSKALLPSFYPVNYRNYLPAKRTVLSFLKDLQADGFASRISKHINADCTKKILDIGFGNGQLLTSLAKKGFKHLYGSDFNSRDCADLEQKGVRLAFSDMETDFPFDEKFDCIIMNNVVEHFVDPVNVLKNCWDHLNTRGKLILVTPSAEAWELGLFQKFWAGFHAPRHTFIFSPRSIRQLAKNLKFANVKIEGFNDPGQWAISIQNLCQSKPTTRMRLTSGLASYAVPLSLAVMPAVLLQNLLGRSTAMLCVLDR